MFQIFIIWAFLLFAESYENSVSVISVPNGGKWGEWGPIEFCPAGYISSGFMLKVESPTLVDDTALNGIGLECRKMEVAETIVVKSKVGQFGKWTKSIWCQGGYLASFTLKVERPMKIGDNTAANNIKFRCSNGSILEGNGTKWGEYDSWSEPCVYGICGIQTKVEPPRGIKDDTSLNDVRFMCCTKVGVEMKN
ncbi:vitelline membrane outer layer protein 1 homolog [Discoglossus pictus]